jgi:transcriptional regulator with GAF, ATPase, and Fis domain
VKRTERQLQAMQEGAVTAPAHGLLGESCQIQDVLRLVDKVARTSRSTVLIRGESGTGKGMVARAIHDASSRAARPFVTVECTSIPEPLLESELFGHEQGAFTGASGRKSGMFELAQGGTVFLDEIGDMSSGAQGKILRAIEDRCIRRVGGAREIGVDVRLIAATNRDLERAVIEDRFRADLLYRLNVFEIELPPLRSRREDVILLAHALLRQFAADMAKDVDGFDPCVLERLRDYRFPGNVRELRNIVERAVILCEGPTITRQDTAALFRPSSEDADASAAPRLEPHGNRTLAEVEAVAIRKA